MSDPKEYVLFTAPNTCARVPTIALEEIGLPFQTRLIRFMRNEHTSESFRAINPKGRVPALLCNGQDEVIGIVDDVRADNAPPRPLRRQCLRKRFM